MLHVFLKTGILSMLVFFIMVHSRYLVLKLLVQLFQLFFFSQKVVVEIIIEFFET